MPPSKPRIGLYPGTFDPVTLGHMDVIQRAARVVDHLVIGVAKHTGKDPLFDTATRVKMVQREVQQAKQMSLVSRRRAKLDPRLRGDDDAADITVVSFDTLLVDFAEQIGASVIIRGLRAVSDFEYEIQMAAMNYRMNSRIETIFLTATEGTQFIASRFVKEIARLGGDVSPFVSNAVVADLKRCFKAPKGRHRVKPEIRD